MIRRTFTKSGKVTLPGSGDCLQGVGLHRSLEDRKSVKMRGARKDPLWLPGKGGPEVKRPNTATHGGGEENSILVIGDSTNIVK